MNWLDTFLAVGAVYLVVGAILGIVVFVVALVFILKIAKDVFRDDPFKDKRRR